MEETRTTLTVLFADIAGSTRYFRELGPVKGRRIVLSCLDRVSAAVEDQGGLVMDRIGDELMCTLPEPTAALLAAVRSQEDVGNAVADGDLPKGMRLRVGFEHGPVIISQGAILGDTVHIAECIVDLAKADQILTSDKTLSLCHIPAGLSTRFLERAQLKGHTNPVDIFELMVDHTNITMGLPEPGATAEQYQRCRVLSRDRAFVVDERSPRLTIGRSADCDLILDAECISRVHARVELQRGRIVCVDQSTNGTLVLEYPQRQCVLVHREDRWLHNSGELRFGKLQDDTGCLTLRYICE